MYKICGPPFYSPGCLLTGLSGRQISPIYLVGTSTHRKLHFARSTQGQCVRPWSNFRDFHSTVSLFFRFEILPAQILVATSYYSAESNTYYQVVTIHTGQHLNILLL